MGEGFVVLTPQRFKSGKGEDHLAILLEDRLQRNQSPQGIDGVLEDIEASDRVERLGTKTSLNQGATDQFSQIPPATKFDGLRGDIDAKDLAEPGQRGEIRSRCRARVQKHGDGSALGRDQAADQIVPGDEPPMVILHLEPKMILVQTSDMGFPNGWAYRT